MVSQGDHSAAPRQFAEQGIGGRTRTATLRGEQLDHGQPLIGPGRAIHQSDHQRRGGNQSLHTKILPDTPVWTFDTWIGGEFGVSNP